MLLLLLLLAMAPLDFFNSLFTNSFSDPFTSIQVNKVNKNNQIIRKKFKDTQENNMNKLNNNININIIIYLLAYKEDYLTFQSTEA